MSFSMNPLAMAEIERIGRRVQENAAEDIAQDARRYAPVDTGQLMASIHAEGDSVVAEADHARYVEYGTEDAEAQPFLRPALYQHRKLRGD